MFTDFNMILWFISIKLNILGTLKFNMQVHVVIPQIFFVFQILCKYSLGLFLLTMHSRKGWHLDRTEGPAIIASLIKKNILPFWPSYEQFVSLCIRHLYTFHICIFSKTIWPIWSHYPDSEPTSLVFFLNAECFTEKQQIPVV